VEVIVGDGLDSSASNHRIKEHCCNIHTLDKEIMTIR
jgi:hypothetical protein